MVLLELLDILRLLPSDIRLPASDSDGILILIQLFKHNLFVKIYYDFFSLQKLFHPFFDFR